MKLKISRDEKTDRVYVIGEKIGIIKRKYELYDGRKNFIARITSDFSRKKYKFLENDIVIDELDLVPLKTPRQYKLSNHNWILNMDITFTEYSIHDENNQVLAEIRYNLPDNSWLIDIKTIKDITLIMLMIITVISISQN